MKKVMSLVAVTTFLFAIDTNAQEPKKEKKVKTEKASCCSSKKDKASCGDKAEADNKEISLQEATEKKTKSCCSSKSKKA